VAAHRLVRLESLDAGEALGLKGVILRAVVREMVSGLDREVPVAAKLDEVGKEGCVPVVSRSFARFGLSACLHDVPSRFLLIRLIFELALTAPALSLAEVKDALAPMEGQKTLHPG
jgi:hypothetical protein